MLINITSLPHHVCFNLYSSTFIENFRLPLKTGLREWFAQTDERGAPPRIPVMVNMASSSVSSKKTQKIDDLSVQSASSLDQITASRNSVMIDEYSDEDEEQMPDAEHEVLSYHYLFPFLFNLFLTMGFLFP